jgi:S-adenosylmethionine:tRNA ribosyltransferase-isomerase
MISKLDKLLNLYDYHLPPELIAQSPAKPRDSARLLVYGRRSNKINFDRFYNLPKYLPKNSVLVFNQTKVWPARLVVTKPSGGKARLLYISHDKKFIKTLSDRPLVIKSDIRLKGNKTFKVVKRTGQFYFLKPSFPIPEIPNILKQYGITPLPPYIKNSPLSEKQRREQYQTVFAHKGLSVAAPTASLHFTKSLMSKLKQRGIDIKFVQLDVGLGTFAPLRDDNLKSGKLHQEFYSIDKQTAKFISNAKKQHRPIIAVGTTVVRTLESAAIKNQIKKLTGNTNLFIQEGYNFKIIDGLITNFHVPKSSLMMLVSAFMGRKKLLNVYGKAIEKRFSFFSFGDGMLINPVDI